MICNQELCADLKCLINLIAAFITFKFELMVKERGIPKHTPLAMWNNTEPTKSEKEAMKKCVNEWFEKKGKDHDRHYPLKNILADVINDMTLIDDHWTQLPDLYPKIEGKRIT